MGYKFDILREERWNSNGHQFHQYQQNEQSPLILTERTEHKKNMVLGTCTQMWRV
jgi:hypothetical protein